MKSRKTHPVVMSALIERGRAIPATPDSVRARTLARAHASMGGIAIGAAAGTPKARPRGLAMALAAVVAFAVGAAVAAVTLRSGGPETPAVAPPPRRPVKQVACATPTPSPPTSSIVAPQPSAAPKPQPSERPISAQESYAAELRVLQRAQVAFRTQDFTTTLRLVAEHQRRFPNGRLAQEREALRVKALKGTGREKEARQAASAFETKYPRSPLLR